MPEEEVLLGTYYSILKEGLLTTGLAHCVFITKTMILRIGVTIPRRRRSGTARRLDGIINCLLIIERLLSVSPEFV